MLWDWEVLLNTVCLCVCLCVCKYFEEEDDVLHLIYIAQAYGYKSLRSTIHKNP